MYSLKLNHYPQIFEVGCLAACSQMVLDGLGISISQAKLHQQFDPTAIGVPFSRLNRLQSSHVKVVLKQGDLPDLMYSLHQKIPPIIFVRTGQLSYWQSDTQHALVIVGYHEQQFLVHDPAFLTAPQLVLIDELMLAWDELDNFYALLTLK